MKSKVPGNITVHASIQSFKHHIGSLPTAGRLRQSHPQAIANDFGTGSASTHTQRGKAASGSDPRGNGTEPVGGGGLAQARSKASPNGLGPSDKSLLAGSSTDAVSRLHHTTAGWGAAWGTSASCQAGHNAR